MFVYILPHTWSCPYKLQFLDFFLYNTSHNSSIHCCRRNKKRPTFFCPPSFLIVRHLYFCPPTVDFSYCQRKTAAGSFSTQISGLFYFIFSKNIAPDIPHERNVIYSFPSFVNERVIITRHTCLPSIRRLNSQPK